MLQNCCTLSDMLDIDATNRICASKQFEVGLLASVLQPGRLLAFSRVPKVVKVHD
jgi:hypothetical protein